MSDDPTTVGEDDNPRLPQLIFTDLAFATRQPIQRDEDVGDNENESRNETGDSEEDADEDWVRSEARCPLAFARNPAPSDSHRYLARLRSCVTSSTGTKLNVEFFGDVSWPRMVCFVPGVCESAETWTVQNLARICRSRRWRLAVLEPEGHGLSDGPNGRGVLLPGHWERYVDQVTSFCDHALAVDRMQKRTANATTTEGEAGATIPKTRFVLAGASMGGALAAYASEKLLGRTPRPGYESESEFDSGLFEFVGTLLLSPAVGIDASAVPPPPLVAALSVLARWCPSVGVSGVTPTEDPSHYDCPPGRTTRNFAGPWPLGTSKLLLDVVSERIPSDVREGSLKLNPNPNPSPHHPAAEGHDRPQAQAHAVWVLTGRNDPVVPIGSVREFVEGINRNRRGAGSSTEDGGGGGFSSPPIVELIEIPRGDHSLLVPAHGSKTKNKTLAATKAHVVAFLDHCEALDRTKSR